MLPWEVFNARNRKSRELEMGVCRPRKSYQSQLYNGWHFASFTPVPAAPSPMPGPPPMLNKTLAEWMTEMEE